MPGSPSESAQEHVARALAHLGDDAASAPPVPAEVTARIGAAIRAESGRAAHALRARPRPGRIQIVAVVVGLVAVAAAIAIGVLALSRTDTAPRFPSGPTADLITRSVSGDVGDTPKPVVTHP
jgi:hypothetical protein